MIDALEELRREHANAARLLRTLEWQVAEFREGRQPDYDVIRAALDYFLSFPGLYHHPKEDLLFAKLRERDPTIVEKIGDLRAAHEALDARARQFAAGVRAVLVEAEVPREAFLRWSSAFIDRQWEHMQMEEGTFFPAAELVLTAADWSEINAQITEANDPLFGEKRGEQFARLHQTILEWQTQDERAAAAPQAPLAGRGGGHS